jgi:hypothetical protein
MPLEIGAPGGEADNARAMIKVAYFSFIAALVATPLQLVLGNSHTRVAVLALFLLTATFAAIGFQRRP